jgi:single-strand DNA-binding protein
MNDDGGRRRGRARGLNKVQIIGNLGRDPELRFTQDGTPVANFSVAVGESWQSRDGEMREHTEWFRIVAWRRLAEIANEYLRKGSRVYLEGRLRTREWQDREGNDRTTTELDVRDMMMLSGREASDGPSDAYDGPPRSQPPSDGPPGGRPNADDSITADDLPF